MTANQLHAIADNGSLTIKINGPMDLRLTSALRDYCDDSGATYDRYIVDLQQVSVVRDSGLGVLLMLKRLANRAGASLKVINVNAALTRQCIKLGI